MTIHIKDDLGVCDGGAPGDVEKINAALSDPCNAGQTLYFPAGIYPTPDPYTMTVAMNIAMDMRAVLRGDFAPGDGKDVLRVAIQPPYNGENDRNIVIEGGSIFCATGGNCAINVNPDGDDCVPQFQMEIRNGNHAGWLRAIRFGGANEAGDTNFNTITGCNLSTISSAAEAAVELDGCADGHRVLNNLIFGPGIGVKVNVVYGASNTTIENNGITCGSASLLVTNGSMVIFEGNQCEQANMVNPLGAHVVVQGLATLSRAGSIRNNNFGGGPNVARSIDFYGAREWEIDCNRFYPGSAGDIRFLDAGPGLRPDFNIIGPGNKARGNRSLRSGCLTDIRRRLVIEESATCIGNRGFWKPQSVLGLTHGWTTGHVDVMVDPSGIVRFDGNVDGGTTALGTVIGTLPAAMRPNSLVLAPVATESGTFSYIAIVPNGAITTGLGIPAAPNNRLNLSHISFPANPLSVYEPGEL